MLRGWLFLAMLSMIAGFLPLLLAGLLYGVDIASPWRWAVPLALWVIATAYLWRWALVPSRRSAFEVPDP